MSTHTRFFRSRSDAMVAGVCSGIARALSLERWVVRLIFLILVIGFGTGVLAYIVLWFIMPEERSGTGIVQRAPGRRHSWTRRRPYGKRCKQARRRVNGRRRNRSGDYQRNAK